MKNEKPNKTKNKRPYKRVVEIPRFFVKLFLPKQKTVWHGEKPSKPAVFVCNHARTFGPLAMMSRFELYKQSRPWVIGEICNAREIPAYARKDFWCKEGKWYTSLYYKTVPYVACAIVPPIMKWIGAIPVYHDSRVRKTISRSVEYLKRGDNIILFPEKPEEFGKYSEDFMTGFVLMARQFEKKTGEKLDMYPVWLDKKSRQINVGTPVQSDKDLNAKEDAKIVADKLASISKSMQLIEKSCN